MILVFVFLVQLFNIFYIPQVEFVDFFLVWISNFAHRNRRSHCQGKIEQTKQYPISESENGLFQKKWMEELQQIQNIDDTLIPTADMTKSK